MCNYSLTHGLLPMDLLNGQGHRESIIGKLVGKTSADQKCRQISPNGQRM